MAVMREPESESDACNEQRKGSWFLLLGVELALGFDLASSVSEWGGGVFGLTLRLVGVY